MNLVFLFNIIYYIQIGIAIILGVLIILALSNIRYLHRVRKYTVSDYTPFVSIMVPARNEEENISNCVSSLLKQDYPSFEVFVLDDNSTDRTWEILQGFAGQDAKLKLIKGKPLPDDWLGKQWACHQLAQSASGELLLFVDSDTTLKPPMLRYAVSAMQKEKADLISALPHQEVQSWSEKICIPIFYLGMLCGLPYGITRFLRNPLLFAVLGQFLLFKREAYDKAGGFEAVRQNIVDDIAIGRRVHSMGMCYKMLDGDRLLTCRMYRNFQQTWKGLTKSTFATFNFNPFMLILIWMTVLVIVLVPLITLFLGLTLPWIPHWITASSLLAVCLAITLFSTSNIRFHFPLYVILIYPLSVVFMTVIAISSMILTMRGKATWKGRAMPKAAYPQ